MNSRVLVGLLLLASLAAAPSPSLAFPAPVILPPILPIFSFFRDRAAPIELEVRFEVAGEAHPISLDEEGFRTAVEVLSTLFPGETSGGDPRYQETGAWQLLQELSRPDFLAEFLRVADLSSKKKFRVTVILDDLPETLRAGEELEIPGKNECEEVRRCKLAGRFFCDTAEVCVTTHTVEDGETLADLAARYGASEEDLKAANRGRFEIGAATHTRDGERDVRFGEGRLQRAGEIDDFLPVMLHEVGHVADDTRCRLDYGPDGSHFGHEIATPATAFKEGWADWVGARLPGFMQRFVDAPSPVAIEGSEEGQGKAGVYLTIEDRDRTLSDLLSNEAWVGASLRVLAEQPPGEAGVEAAFRASNRHDRRTLAQLLERWGEAHPGQVDAATDALMAEMEEHAQLVPDRAQVARLFEGELPANQDPETLPRPRDYVPSGDAGGVLADLIARILGPGPAEKAEEETAPPGLFGQAD